MNNRLVGNDAVRFYKEFNTENIIGQLQSIKERGEGSAIGIIIVNVDKFPFQPGYASVRLDIAGHNMPLMPPKNIRYSEIGRGGKKRKNTGGREPYIKIHYSRSGFDSIPADVLKFLLQLGECISWSDRKIVHPRTKNTLDIKGIAKRLRKTESDTYKLIYDAINCKAVSQYEDGFIVTTDVIQKGVIKQ